MQYDNAASPIKECIYVTDKRLLKEYPNRSYVTKRFVKCTNGCFVQSLYNEYSDFFQYENIVAPSNTSYIISSDYHKRKISVFSTRERVYHLTNVHTSKFPLFDEEMEIPTRCKEITKNITETEFEGLCKIAAMDELILEKEPIDVVFKYIDLSDPALKREGIAQIKKDKDNEELKYALRSVLTNIPWVRYIFIVMPNDAVRFLKPQDEIAEKIKFIRDKDVLGFDSASSITFEFNFWKLKNFGVSENFIYMNDDYFIGKPLKKSDFFYVDNGKVVPYMLYNDSVDYKALPRILNYYKKIQPTFSGNITEGGESKTKQIKKAHSNNGFQYQKFNGILFACRLFKREVLTPVKKLEYFPHNALGENISDLKEVYDLVKNNYKYADDCLTATSRTSRSFVHQSTYTFYVLNKYHRRINPLNDAYIDMSTVLRANFDKDLFCVNEGGDEEYTKEMKDNEKRKLEELFPVSTKYEK